MGYDGLVYNLSDGPTAAVVSDGGNVAIVYRGADLGARSAGAHAYDDGDLLDDIERDAGCHGDSQASDAVALARIVAHELANDDASEVRVTGPSLGGGFRA